MTPDPGPRMVRPYLIAAVTGRPLAASARRGGHDVVVLDYFADRDTRLLASRARAVCSPRSLRFDRRALLASAAELAPAGQSAGLVYGSGFEARPELLARLAEGRRLLGNPPAVVEVVKDPRCLFPLLDRLGVPHPEVSYDPPPDPEGWLLKEAGGAGGVHVRPASRRAPPARGYFQRFIRGRTLSGIFLANRSRALLVGTSEQWMRSTDRRPFLYAGAVGHVAVPAPLEREITTRLDELVAATGLVGLNGVDFILADGEWWLLEVNPRPTATMELYDADWPGGLFAAHLRACEGDLPGERPPAAASRAHAIVTSPVPWRVSEAFAFPEWCRDLPIAGTEFRPGNPVCTVLAEAESPVVAAALARERERGLTGAIERAAREPVPA